MDKLAKEIIDLLKQLISVPSLSREEDKTADLLNSFFNSQGVKIERYLNNIWTKNKYFDKAKPTILLNSHHDTVKPNKGYTKDPFNPEVADGKLYGLGSNDAGGPLVALIGTFLYFHNLENLKYNVVVAATAEEEISGKNGIEALLPQLPSIDFAIVGEPTLMQMAVAEKGLLVIDCYSKGVSGHAARNEGINSIYNALEDINWFKNFEFPDISPSLGKIHMNVTQIEAGSQHNVVF
ncbi:MAG: M20/M25/M40 family metallo-hydrolase [Bacteroidota bacterium]